MEQTAKETITLLNTMRQLMQQAQQQLRTYRFYSQDLLHHLFRYPTPASGWCSRRWA